MVQQATTRIISRETESIAGNCGEWAIKSRVTNVVTLQTLTDSDEGLTLETSAFESLYGAQFTLSYQLIPRIRSGGMVGDGKTHHQQQDNKFAI